MLTDDAPRWGNTITATANDGEVEIVHKILRRISDKKAAIDNASGITLHAAAKAGHLEILQELIRHCSHLDRIIDDQKGCEGGTASLVVCLSGEAEVVKNLRRKAPTQI